MKVLKFGGTSVGTVESLRNVKAIVESCDEQVIVVVSALGGITDCLINTARQASAGEDFTAAMRGIVERHHNVVSGIVPAEKRASVLDAIDPLLDELGKIYQGVSLIGELSPRTLDVIVSFGERISSRIVTAIIRDAVRFNSLDFIKTRTSFDKHILANEVSQPLIHKAFDDFNGPVAVVPGFISTDAESGEITNLGRGGSDYTAAILAAAMGARILEIWTDVDGFMTADPRVIDTAYVIDTMTFVEAMELCNFGAKVIYPPTIYPVFHKNIPIVIKNTFNPSAPGTLVSDTAAPGKTAERMPVKGISSINDTCLITLTGMGMVGSTGINSRIFNALARKGVSVFMVSQASSENLTSFAVKNDISEIALHELRDEFAEELQSGMISEIMATAGLATVAIVGEKMKENRVLAGKIFNTLRRNAVPVTAFSHGTSETNISFVTELSELKRAMKVIHDGFFLAQNSQVDLILCGDTELAARFRTLAERSLAEAGSGQGRMRLRIVNDRPAADAAALRAMLADVEDHAAAPVIVDCGDDAAMAGVYAEAAELGMAVATANAAAAASADISAGCNAAVMPGAPVADILKNLIASGDHLTDVRATFAGTDAAAIISRIGRADVMPLDAPAEAAAVRITSARHCSSPLEIISYDPGIDATADALLRDIPGIANQR